jgi:hypothetical protein
MDRIGIGLDGIGMERDWFFLHDGMDALGERDRVVRLQEEGRRSYIYV